ncbi:hypothetical protein JOQ06_001417 [Pogonophryne albipinna]|uniref:Uncharacterized protein n=1 Tax=Pogonophryne albipinna TaxID=1090488 RepID=A0AAD6B5V1_9TELE|nr:hypothetical protein JOQ06_001417 [Pogonophryne albipinna]
MLRKAHEDLVQQTATNKVQQMVLEHMKAEKDALQSELRAIRPMLGVAKTHMELELESYLELERGETRKITTALKKAEDLLATERLQFKQEILQDVKHQTSTNKEQQMALERMKEENQALQSELCVLRPMLCVAKTTTWSWRAISNCLEILQDVKHQTSTNKEQQMALERMKAKKDALQSELRAIKPMLCVGKTHMELESYLELERGETRKITTALKKAEDLLATERLQFKQKILQDVKHQTSTNKEQQMALERMKAENQALQSELCVLRPMLCVAKTNVELELESYLELERGETRKITTALKKAEDLLATERLQFKQEILQDVKHQTSTNKEQQMALERMKEENQALQSELCVLRPMLCVAKTNVELESHLKLERRDQEDHNSPEKGARSPGDCAPSIQARDPPGCQASNLDKQRTADGFGAHEGKKRRPSK